ncbi:MAG: GntR family transcriptional regulator [Delftia sp.]|nr:GntR family transcriptional regulator [Delftia sp.]
MRLRLFDPLRDPRADGPENPPALAFDRLRPKGVHHAGHARAHLPAADAGRQEALAQELEVSQAPVREALKQLAAEGLAELIPYKGVKVAEFSPEDIVDILTVRLVLEGLATRLATPLITVEDLEQLQENIREAESYTRQNQMAPRRRLNTEFHLSICRASGRRYLTRQIEALWGWFPSVMLYEGLRRQDETLSVRLEWEKQEHRAILAAMKNRDAEQAEQETQRHIRNLVDELPGALGIAKELVESVKTF